MSRRQKRKRSSGSHNSEESLRGRSRRPRNARSSSGDSSPSSAEHRSSESSFSRSSSYSPPASPSTQYSPSLIASENSPSPARTNSSPSPPRSGLCSSRSTSPHPQGHRTSAYGPPQEPCPSDFHKAAYPNAGTTFGKGKTSLEEMFYADQYANERKDNMFYPFACEMEWELAAWLQRTHMSTELLDQFFKLRYV